jgi:hypothetical protein
MARYDQVRFRATHNSYSGGSRGSIEEQLRSGVRLIEFDFHAKGFTELQDFRVGHLKPGMEVARGHGNPDTLALRDWLEAVAGWSNQNVHAPITIVFDSKNDLVSSDCGSLAELNEELRAIFSAQLFTRDDYDAAGGWPDTSDMLNRIVCVLSGNGDTRASYRWAFGTQPAMSINSKGDVALVYRSTAGDLNSFLGRVEDSGAIVWQHKSTYCFSKLLLSEPAVSVNDNGWIVAAHRLEPPQGFIGSRLEYKVGRIGDDRRITWSEGGVFGQGETPRLTINGNEVREQHADSGGRRLFVGALKVQSRKVDWGKARRTQAAPPASDAAIYEGRTFTCGSDGGGAILCGVAGSELLPVRFPQLMFVEEQKGDDRGTLRDALFFAADAKDKAALAAASATTTPLHQVVRAWGFEQPDVPSPAAIAATDDPLAVWYQAYTTGANVAV